MEYKFSIDYKIEKCEDCPLLDDFGMHEWTCLITHKNITNSFGKNIHMGSCKDPRPALAELFKQCPLKLIEDDN